jgi:L-aminopeptidase/D-esterase-like protein
VATSAALGSQTPSVPAGSITDVPGIRVGHHTLSERPTGCTVILAPPNTVGAVDQRGGAPGTAETNLLAPENMVEMVNAIVLSGGSAYGLASRDGVMTYFREKKIGYQTAVTVVPIVPAAILFDLGVGDNPEITPTADCGYRAASAAAGGIVAEGSVGAGAGATVGKFGGAGRSMKGGIGTASVRGGNGLVVGALIAVNSVGSIFDRRTGKVVAGVRTPDGAGLEDPFEFLRRVPPAPPREVENTTIGVVATNARLTKAQALRVAIMAQDGLARAMFPSHTPGDGDTLFVLATGELTGAANVSQVGTLGSEAVSDAILNAVLKAKGLPGYPSVADIKR